MAELSVQSFQCLVAIPARFGSTRFPGKPLHPIAGRPLIQHVWERCRQARDVCGVVIATDDERIADAARGFGADVMMTRHDHLSGTDRLAEVAAARPEVTHLINVQGDEPLVNPELIDELAGALRADPSLPMITAASRIEGEAARENPNVVKVVMNTRGDALYFSRSLIPFPRAAAPAPVHRHLGIYGYRREFLEQFVQWPPSPLELTEGLEQLRALENGARIRVLLTREASPGVDTPEQAAEVEALIFARARLASGRPEGSRT